MLNEAEEEIMPMKLHFNAMNKKHRAKQSK